MQRILVIDDDPGITGVPKRGLAYESYTVDIAGSGAQGLTAARDRIPHPRRRYYRGGDAAGPVSKR